MDSRSGFVSVWDGKIGVNRFSIGQISDSSEVNWTLEPLGWLNHLANLGLIQF